MDESLQLVLTEAKYHRSISAAKKEKRQAEKFHFEEHGEKNDGYQILQVEVKTYEEGL
jgi:hypothetical protein